MGTANTNQPAGASRRRCAMNNRFLVLILIMMGFTISETTVVIAQPSQLIGINSMLDGLDSDDKRMILTCLKTNGADATQSDPTPAFTVDKRDFFKAFSQLFEDSNDKHNTTTIAIQ